MKTINTLFLLIAMLLSSSSLFAHDFEVDGIYYNITSSTEMTVEVTYKGDRVSEYQDEYSGSVSIPRIVKRGNTMYRVTGIGYGAFNDCPGITSVSIPNSVVSIDHYAFEGCSRLTSVEIPNSVTSIGNSAFEGCSRLTSVTIPNSVTSIGRGAFYQCFGLTSVTIPNSVTSIGSSAFNRSGLTSVTIGNSVTSIGDNAFYECFGLTLVTIPNSVTSIGESAFYHCIGLTSLTIGSGVKSIGRDAFAGHNNLEKVYAMSSNAVNCSQNIFSTTVYENAALYVPEGSISSYENTAPWWFFYNIIPIPTAIEGVEMDAEDRNAPVYNLQGMKMQDAENLPKGIYVKNGKKFLVK